MTKKLRLRAGALVGILLTVLVAMARPLPAATVGTATFRVEGNTSTGQYCVLVNWNDLPLTVFGTPVNLGTSAVTEICTGTNIPPLNTGHCGSTPDAGQFAYDYTVISTAPQPGGFSFVGDVSNATGAIPTAIGPSTMTFDGFGGGNLSLPAPTIPGCAAAPNVYFEGTVTSNAFQAESTSVGTNVTVSSSPSYTNPSTGVVETIPVDVTFGEVAGSGQTTVVALSSVAGAIPSGFSLDIGGYRPSYIDVSTDATVVPPITICQHYADTNDDGIVDGTTLDEGLLAMLHGEGVPVAFVDRTSSRDAVNNVICAEVSSLSPFVVAAGSPAIHDSAVVPVKPVKVVLGNSGATLTKIIKVQVRNADLAEAAGHPIQLAVTGSTCPASLLLDAASQPVSADFDTKSAVIGDTATVAGGKHATARIPLRVVAADYTSPNALSPARCAITLTATSLDAAPVAEVNPSNNTVTVHIDVIDKSDF